MNTSDPDLQRRPAQLTVAAVLLAGQGLLVAGWSLVSLVLLLLGRTEAPTQFAMLVVTVLVLALLPLAAARGLWQQRRWGRGPGIVVQLLSLPVAWQLAQADGWLMVGGLALGAVALTALAMLMSPATAVALGIAPRDNGVQDA